MISNTHIQRLRGAVARFAANRRGVAMLEFAFSAPIVLGIGCYGIELANFSLIHMRVSQIALNLADNASRVGLVTSGATQLREVDVNDIFAAVRYQGKGIKLTTNGRVTLSSLENVAQKAYPDVNPVQRIHWQRCIGQQSGSQYDSQYKANVASSAGSTSSANNKGYDLPNGIVDVGSGSAAINAPSGSGVMYVEINYNYQPLFGTWLMAQQRVHYIASFIVRDQRDFTQMFNPSPTSTAATCNLYTT